MDEEERQKLNAALRKPERGKRRDVERHFHAMQMVMSDNADLRRQFWKIINCSAYRPCNQAECLHCGAGVPFRERPRKPDHLMEMFGEDYLRGKSRNFRANVGYGVAGVFDHFREHEVHAVTLGIHFGAKEMDCLLVNKSWRTRFKRFMKKKLPNAVVYLVADVAAEDTASFALDWPQSDMDAVLGRPEVRAGLYLHAHGFIADHGLTEKRLRQVLREFFVGRRRVEIGKPQPVEIDDKGRVRGGAEGFLEYGGMEKYDLDLPDDDPEFDNVAMFEAMKRARMAWPRNARKTKINHKSKPARKGKPPSADVFRTLGLFLSDDARATTRQSAKSAPIKWSHAVRASVPLRLKDPRIILESDFFGNVGSSPVHAHHGGTHTTLEITAPPLIARI